jgi:TRAP-type C4-dicarboxylate transport system substrate-binding protein
MLVTRRGFLLGVAAAPAAALLGRATAATPATLKVAHQFPGGTITQGDFRDRLCRMFAAELDKRSNGMLKGSVYPGSSLMKTNAQFSALRKGALDCSLFPISYAGGEVPEFNLGLMPGLVTSYEQGMRFKTSDAGKAFASVFAEKGIVALTWVWQAGGVASRAKAIVDPEDAKGMKVRGGSREMDMVLKAAGAAVLSLPSNEVYQSMQTGALDAAMTSSTSLISFRLEEVAKNLTTGRGRAYWFMLEPLFISRRVLEGLPKDMQALVIAVGADLEKFAYDAAKADDVAVAQIYQKAGAKVHDLSAATVAKWQAIARDTAWKDYAAKSERCALLLKLTEKTL